MILNKRKDFFFNNAAFVSSEYGGELKEIFNFKINLKKNLLSL